MNRKMTLTEPDHIRHAREMSVRWLLMPTTKQKKTYIQICPRTQVNSDYYGYYPVAAENYRKTSQSKYMILNENHICLNRYGEIAEEDDTKALYYEYIYGSKHGKYNTRGTKQ